MAAHASCTYPFHSHTCFVSSIHPLRLQHTYCTGALTKTNKYFDKTYDIYTLFFIFFPPTPRAPRGTREIYALFPIRSARAKAQKKKKKKIIVTEMAGISKQSWRRQPEILLSPLSNAWNLAISPRHPRLSPVLANRQEVG